jgi:hypothetical protein
MGLFDFLKKKEFEEIKQLKLSLEKYRPIMDVEEEVKRRREESENLLSSKNSELLKLESDFKELEADYNAALETYKQLRNEVGVFEGKLDFIEFGVYEPVYDFEKSDEYRNEQNLIIEKQKEMIAQDTAAICETNWAVEGSEAKGRAIIKVYKKLMLRAFNGECDYLIAKVKWNNIAQMKERMSKLFEAINKLGQGFHVHLNSEYLDLKIKELVLEYEYQDKRQKEKEELRAIQEELREEEKARREFEQAQKEAEKEEQNYQKALEKARKEYAATTGEAHDLLQKKIEKRTCDFYGAANQTRPCLRHFKYWFLW